MGFLNSGLDLSRDLLIGVKSTQVSHFAWGAGSNAFDATDTALGSELFPSGTGTQRNALSATVEKPGQAIFTGRLEANQLVGGSIFEVGLTTAISGNIILLRDSSAKRLKTATLEFINDWYLTVKDI